MKRSLLVAGLVLTIATSVISGTLAAYNVTVGPLAADSVVAKSFVLTAEKNNVTDFVDKKIAPGEKITIPFTVVGTSETGMDVEIAVGVTNPDKIAISPLTYRLFKDATLASELTFTVNNGRYEYNELDINNSGLPQTENFFLVVEWPYDKYDNGDTTFQGGANGNTVQITVSGFQSAD